MLTNTTLNRLGFGISTHWNSYVLIAFVDLYIVPVMTDSSVLIQSNIVWNLWKKIHKSVPEPRTAIM